VLNERAYLLGENDFLRNMIPYSALLSAQVLSLRNLE
jgi:hypothetical protein